MKTEIQLKELLQELNPTLLKVQNDSHKHNVPPNSETHFTVVIVSDLFQDLSLIKRHQKVYALLSSLLNNPIHALALHTFTQQEWLGKQSIDFSSPDCLGGSKK